MENKEDIDFSLAEKTVQIGGDPYYSAWAHFKLFGYYNHPGSEQDKISENDLNQTSVPQRTEVKK